MDSTEFSTFSMPTTLTTQYGWQWETRFADTGGLVGLVEWVAFIAGMEKGLFLPSFSSLVGIRGESGFEFATGPNVSPTGLGFVFALGYNYQKGDLNLPSTLHLSPTSRDLQILHWETSWTPTPTGTWSKCATQASV